MPVENTMEFIKAKIVFIKENKEEVMSVQFNPETYSITTSGKVSSNIDISGKEKTQSVPQSHETLKMKLIFDTYGEKTSVRKYITKFVDLVNSYNTEGTPNVCNCKFVWGNFIFSGYLNNISHNYTMFLPNGTPVRANVDISIESDTILTSEKEKEQLEKETLSGQRINNTNPNPRPQ